MLNSIEVEQLRQEHSLMQGFQDVIKFNKVFDEIAHRKAGKHKNFIFLSF